MTFEVKLSQFASRSVFENAVSAHAERLNAFSKEVGKPRPVAHPLVDAALTRIVRPGKADEYVPDYHITDDTADSLEGKTLDDKKQILLSKLAVAENEEKFKILPRLKMRLATAKYSKAVLKLEADRTAEENEDIASYLLVQAALGKISYKAAQAESDIDDLTEDTIDSWVMPPLG